jgi:hypothetical protein
VLGTAADARRIQPPDGRTHLLGVRQLTAPLVEVHDALPVRQVVVSQELRQGACDTPLDGVLCLPGQLSA